MPFKTLRYHLIKIIILKRRKISEIEKFVCRVFFQFKISFKILQSYLFIVNRACDSLEISENTFDADLTYLLIMARN